MITSEIRNNNTLENIYYCIILVHLSVLSFDAGIIYRLKDKATFKSCLSKVKGQL